MKIAIVFEIFYPTVNGIITSSVNPAENLMDQGHEVVFFAPAWKAYDEPLVNGRIPVRYFKSWYNWGYPGMRNVLPWNRSVEVALRQEGVDVVHITGPWLLTWATIRAAGNLGIPVVHTFHTMLHEPSYIQYMFRTSLMVPVIQAIAWSYYGLYVRRARINTGPSMMVCNQLRAHFPEAEVRFISNGVDVDRFGTYASLDELRSRYPEHNDHTFIFVGRLGQEKSVDELIDAMVTVVAEDPEARLLIVGDGPSRRRYQAQIVHRGLGKHVIMLGRVPYAELIASGLIHHSLAFVTASTTENQPMTVIESICCGVPTIVPNVAGITELVEDNGLRFDPHNVESLAEAMLRFLRDPTLRNDCVDATGPMIERFDGRNVAARFEETYRHALTAEPAPKE
jgi:glycosyltransferase involved in cell wall biosynthesis